MICLRYHSQDKDADSTSTGAVFDVSRTMTLINVSEAGLSTGERIPVRQVPKKHKLLAVMVVTLTEYYAPIGQAEALPSVSQDGSGVK